MWWRTSFAKTASNGPSGRASFSRSRTWYSIPPTPSASAAWRAREIVSAAKSQATIERNRPRPAIALSSQPEPHPSTSARSRPAERCACSTHVNQSHAGSPLTRAWRYRRTTGDAVQTSDSRCDVNRPSSQRVGAATRPQISQSAGGAGTLRSYGPPCWFRLVIVRDVPFTRSLPGRIWRRRESMRADWDHRAKENAPFYVCTTGAGSAAAFEASGLRDLNEHVVDGLDVRPEWSVLEIGCGVGRLLRPLAARVARVVGVDLSEEMLRRARDYCAGLPNVELHVTDGRLDFLADGEFDFVF